MPRGPKLAKVMFVNETKTDFFLKIIDSLLYQLNTRREKKIDMKLFNQLKEERFQEQKRK